MADDEPVFLVSVISKTKQTNLTEEQKKRVKEVAKEIKDER